MGRGTGTPILDTNFEETSLLATPKVDILYKLSLYKIVLLRSFSTWNNNSNEVLLRPRLPSFLILFSTLKEIESFYSKFTEVLTIKGRN